MTSCFSQMTQFLAFSPKMTYFDQIDTINDTFDYSSVNKLDRNNFETVLRKNNLGHIQLPKVAYMSKTMTSIESPMIFRSLNIIFGSK